NNVSLIAAIVLPMWNTPLIIRVIKRRSSNDISLWWAFGVWTCFMLMLPKGLVSNDIVFKAFTIANTILFTITVLVIIYFHKYGEKP
ncbi:MAG: hypothetical protein ABIB11_05430, partial [Candidatus Omnitrophota bacterium]